MPELEPALAAACREVCAELCAFKGAPPCYKIDAELGQAWLPCETCEPMGAMLLARRSLREKLNEIGAAVAAMQIDQQSSSIPTAEYQRRVTELLEANNAYLERARLAEGEGSFQGRVGAWMLKCFTPEIADDRVERCDRFIEEALELIQAAGSSRERAHALVDYVFGRPVGEPDQEVGGVEVTLSALCNTFDIDKRTAAERELARINEPDVIEKIRAKQAAKPTGSALPVANEKPAPESRIAEAQAEISAVLASYLPKPGYPLPEHLGYHRDRLLRALVTVSKGLSDGFEPYPFCEACGKPIAAGTAYVHSSEDSLDFHPACVGMKDEDGSINDTGAVLLAELPKRLTDVVAYLDEASGLHDDEQPAPVEAVPAAIEALRLHIAYEGMPTDRGGRDGPKGRAWAAFIAARDAALAGSPQPASHRVQPITAFEPSHDQEPNDA